MKQVILGMVCCMIAIYTIVSCLSIYSISSRRNEVENCVSQVLDQNLQAYYVRPDTNKRLYSDERVAEFVEQDITDGLRSDSEVEITVYACDMEKGIISVGVTEKFTMLGGTEKTIECDKTIIVD